MTKSHQDRYKNLSEEEKGKNHHYNCDWNKSLSEEEKKRKLSIWETII